MLVRSRPLIVALALATAFACKSETKEKPAPVSKTTDAKDSELPAQIMSPNSKTHGEQREQRFKEPAVYVDGKPLGVLKFGEMPIPLEPAWYEERAAIPFKPGHKGPRYRIVKQRRYRYRDYLSAMGVDVAKIKELHIYGGNRHAAAVVIPGDSIRDVDEFQFRFGGNIWGKPIPACPARVGDGKCPDQIGTMALYVEKNPPQRKGGHFYFGDEKIDGIPYLGTPIRGGVRVYLDGPLVTTVKRNKLKTIDLKTTGPEGKEHYKLFDFLKLQGVDTDKVQEAWLVQYERRIKKLSRAELLKVTFYAGESGSGEILMGDDETATHAIMLHTEPVANEDLPILRPEELDKVDG
jgi:hypothetical protein